MADTIRDVILRSGEKYRDRPAVLQKREKGGAYETFTYGRMVEDMNALGAKLADMGLTGRRIALIGASCYQWTVSYLAIVNGIGAVVPLDKELSKEEIEYLIRRAGCDAVFYTGEFEQVCAGLELEHKVRIKRYTGEPDGEGLNWESLVRAGAALPPEKKARYTQAEIDPEAMCVLLFTSGTTGMSKGVMLGHRCMVANIGDMAKLLGFTPEDRNLSILPNHHCFESVMGMLQMFLSGVSVAYGEGLKYILKNLEESGATTLLAVPLLVESLYNRILKSAAKKGAANMKFRMGLSRTLRAVGLNASRRIFRSAREEVLGKVRLIFTGAAPIDPAICRGLADFGIHLLQGYGMTEASALISATPHDSSLTYGKSGSVGVCVSSSRVHVDNPDESGIGEIVHEGPNVMLGYFEMPEQTAEVIKDGCLYTGDLGFLDENGWIYITGRKKNIIVTKTGKNIYPEELEIFFAKNRFIAELLVYGPEDPKNGGAVVSAQIRPDYDVIRAERGELDEDAVFELIRSEVAEMNQQLPNYKRIRNVMLRKEEFVRTASKKLKRHQNV